MRSLRTYLPGWLQKILIRLRGRNIYFDGPFSDWVAASKHSSGYDDSQVIHGVAYANRLVRNGEALFARDGVTFDEPSYRWPVLASLLSSINTETGHLQVIDFGGSLGEFYIQHRSFLGSVAENGWCVVEQAQYTRLGRQEFQDDPVVFYDSLNKAATERHPDVLLLSSVLQYLQHPFDVIESASKLNIKTIIIDRTTMSASSNDEVFVQQVPASINLASYPARVFSEASFIDRVAELGYSVFCRFNCPENTHINCKFMGYVLKKTD